MGAGMKEKALPKKTLQVIQRVEQVNQTAIPRIVTFNQVMENASQRLGREVKFGTYEADPATR